MTTTTTTRLGWHFVAATLRDGSPVPADGEWLRHDGPVIPCQSGLHGSQSVVDALRYATGYTLCRDEFEEPCVEHGAPVDKWAAPARRILQRFDSRPLLRAWARWCALRVAHLWAAPEIVVRYLRTGDESIRATARAAARGAGVACAAARAAAWAADWAADWDAAWGAAWGARDAARGAAWAAARDAQALQLDLMAVEALGGRTEWIFEKPERAAAKGEE